MALLWVITNLFSAAAQETNIVVAGAHWPDYINPDGTGIYLTQIRESFPENVKIKWDVGEFARARRLFESGRADILIGAYRDDYPQELYPDAPLDIENELFAYFLKNGVQFIELRNLNGTMIAWRRGYSFEHLIPDYKGHFDYEDSQLAYRLLSVGKISIILDYEHNVPEGMRDKLSAFPVLPQQPIWLVFHNTERGHMLRSLYKQAN
ncbi:hypothetical protein [Aestuariibacter salexigens]|uniref:hypothetical protein n=1 Tax=Aestuariibacter salexigens TaxID=226010 RepID=UPI000559681C|nr:hypothetical protein [Aestuariibacter salexigens]